MTHKTKKYLRQLAMTNVLKKKHRTKLSLLSILLSTAIIYTSLTLFVNVSRFSNTVNYQSLGDFHYAFYNTENITLSSRFTATKDMDTGYYGTYQEQKINLRIIDIHQEIVPFILVSGTYPKNEDEILVSDDLGLTLNETISLEVSNAKLMGNNLYCNNQIESTQNNEIFVMKVVGIYRKTDIFQDMSQPYTFIYTNLTPTLSSVYYIKDQQIHTVSAFDDFLKIANISGNDVLCHTEMISNDTMRVYMQDSTVILSIFVFITVLGICMSYISIHNVILISDESRKKELGLLKSVGASPKMVKYLLREELIILGTLGSLFGIVCGIGISCLVLNLFIHRFYLTFSFSMVMHPWLMVIAFIVGCLLMYFSGMKAYKKYITSIPVDDLKDVPYAYAKPVSAKSTRKNDASWNLFLIYNERMKDQTKNIRYSFFLVLLTSILFSSVTLSNFVYKNTYTKQEYDIIIKKKFEATNINLDFINGMYALTEDREIVVEDYVIDRLSSQIVITQFNMFLNQETKTFKQILDKNITIAKDADGLQWTNLYMYTTWFDQHQLDVLEPYIVEGDYGQLIDFKIEPDKEPRQYETFIVVLVDNGIEGEGLSLCNNFHTYNQLGTFPIYMTDFAMNIGYSSITEEQNAILSVVIVIPEEDVQKVSEAICIPLNQYPHLMARSYEILHLVKSDKKPFYFDGNETLYIKLKNPSLSMQFQNKLDDLMIRTGVVDDYTYINYPELQETMAFSAFIVEILLYPLFFMLFMVGIINMNNVFSGNIQLKRSDISIMKSVGMKFKELRKMFVFEYLEGYLNASFIIAVMCMILIIGMKYIKINMVINQGNILGALVLSVLFVAPIIIVPLVFITIRKVKTILPIGTARSIE